jgi:SAM-dependent MidA family methyltransferase
MSFAAFMEAALYHPTHGYYAHRVPGGHPGYRTAPSLTRWFGRLVAKALEQEWQRLDRPQRFTVVEVGAGGADLAAAALSAADGAFGDALGWRFVERFDAVRKAQRRRLPPHARVEWVPDLDDGVPVEGCVLANEVLDNMPAHVFEVTGEGIREVYVAATDGRLAEGLGPPSSQPAAELAERALPHLEEGDRLEVRPALDAWCRAAARALRRGTLLVLDYGDVEPDLWVRRPAGSLVTYRDERLGDDPLEEPGRADVTAHVDFSHLDRAARAAGFAPAALRTQREFLTALGLADVVRTLRAEEQEARSAGRHAEGLAALAERSRVEAVAAHGGLGDLLVFTARREEPRAGV